MNPLTDLRCPICGVRVTGSRGFLEAPTMVVQPCGHEIPRDSFRRTQTRTFPPELIDWTGEKDMAPALLAFVYEGIVPDGPSPDRGESGSR